MGRPVNSKWMGADDSDSQFLVLARIPGQSAAECVIVRQKTAKSFIVALDSDINTQGVCTLVNKKEGNIRAYPADIFLDIRKGRYLEYQ